MARASLPISIPMVPLALAVDLNSLLCVLVGFCSSKSFVFRTCVSLSKQAAYNPFRIRTYEHNFR